MRNNYLLMLMAILVSQLTLGQTNFNVDQRFKKAVFSAGNNQKLPFRLLYPTNLDQTKRYPLVLFLHGAGSQGNDNESHLLEVPGIFIKAATGNQYPCFVLAPQCPQKDAWVWFPQYPLCTSAKEPSQTCRLTLAIIDSLVKAIPIDTHRIYVTGLSLGGEGTFDIITRRPCFFAAAAPICGIADTAKAQLMKYTPLWIFHGDSDEINPVNYSRNIVKALRSAGAYPTYTEYKGVDHNSWTRAYNEPALLEWMFSQKLKN